MSMLDVSRSGTLEDIDEASIAIPLPDSKASSHENEDVVPGIDAQIHEDML